ncbi:MAG: hypothetical protein Q7T46_09590 [Polaromonas sp.]|nr:hypothetical protein [Polaromonas sp.]
MKFSHKSLSVVGLLSLAVFVLVLGWFAQSKSFKTIEIRGAEYIGASVDSGRGGIATRMTGPVSVREIKHPLDLKTLDISFEFSTQEPTFSYGNLFQTGDSIDAIRMELQPSSNLVLILGDGKLFNLSKSIQIGKSHVVRLNYEKAEFLKVVIDEKEVLDITDKVLLSGKFDISNIVLGTGLARQRTLLGTVRNFNLNGAYSYYDKVASMARWMLIALCGIVFLKSFPRGSIAEVEGGAPSTSSVLADSIAVYGLSLGFVAMALFSVHYFGEKHLGLSKWLAHLILPVSLVLVLLAIRRLPCVWKWVRWPLGGIFIAYVTYIVTSMGYKVHAYDSFILCLYVFSLLAFGMSLSGSGSYMYMAPSGKKRLNLFLAIGVFGLFLALSWSGLVNLTNWNGFKQTLDNNFGIVVVGAFLILRATFAIVLGPENSNEIAVQNSEARGNKSHLSSLVWTDAVAIVTFSWISFRQDSLFIPGSEYHWEYYVGVIQGIRNGGWLLWDTPSQYGFLNILLASLVPSASAWQSFYIFQGTLLFLVSTGIYLAARRYTSTSLFQRSAVFLVVFMALFFADPELIGPYPFPSSSVVRFFCVYALVLVVWFIPKFGLRQATALALAWSLAVIWSAESAIYGTAIFLFILVTLLQTRTAENRHFALAGKYVVIATTCLAMVFLTVLAFYLSKLGMAPDLRSFFEHAIGYAGGFGYVPFPLFGNGNLLLLVFMGIAILIIGVIQREDVKRDNLAAPLAAMAGCIWGVATYYIGRPVPQNITAILPIIAMVVYLALVLSRRISHGAYSLPIKAAAVPLFFLLLIPLSNLKWFQNLAQVQSFAADVTVKLPKAGDGLEQLLSRANPLADISIVYYGDEAAPPVFTGRYAKLNETNWLPVPLQLLEMPVSEARRSIYLQRYICRKQAKAGILINRRGDAIEVRLQGFLDELRQYYDHVEVISDKEYKLYRFSEMNLQHCPTGLGKRSS